MMYEEQSLPLKASPHAHDRSSVSGIMLQVCLALVPATAWGIYCFGWPALLVWLVSCLSAILSEALCLHLQQQPLQRCLDGSALLTGWLLAITMPPWSPWWLVAGGSAFAIIIGKQIYGGIGQNPFNPALLARTALLISFPAQMTTWVNLAPLGSAAAPGFIDSLSIIFQPNTLPDGLTGATWLGASKVAVKSGADMVEWLQNQFILRDSLLGLNRGSLGETSELCVLAGGLWLLARGIISWHIPVALLAIVAMLSTATSHFHAELYAGPLFHISSGGILLGAFFFATDYVTSPTTATGKLVFGIGCGLLIFVIRSWGGFPEAVAFAILFMNTLTPMIDRIMRPRAYGRTLTGKAIKHVSARKVV